MCARGAHAHTSRSCSHLLLAHRPESVCLRSGGGVGHRCSPRSRAATFCPPADTSCPRADKLCPRAATFCPPADTFCPPTDTFCPPTDTSCPPADTFCPPADTSCPRADKLCPPADTFCSPAGTSCPRPDKLRPPADTFCPPAATSCPRADKLCPPPDKVLRPPPPIVPPLYPLMLRRAVHPGQIHFPTAGLLGSLLLTASHRRSRSDVGTSAPSSPSRRIKICSEGERNGAVARR